MELTEEKVLELITTALGTFKGELLSEVDRKNQGLAANLTKELKTIKDQVKPESKDGEDSPGEGNEGRLTVKALQTQLESLKSELAEKDQRALDASRRSAIAATVAKHTLNQPGIVQKLFADQYSGKLKNEGDRWFLEDGEKVTELDDLFKSYLSTDEGKYFVPATGLNGAGSKEAKPATTPGNAKADPLKEAFGQLAELSKNFQG